MIDFEDVKTLSLKPGQTLVVKIDGLITREMQERIHQAFASRAPMLEERLAVIDKTITLSVVDAEAA